MKEFFNLTAPYNFEINDLRCFITLINVALIILFGSSVAYFGLIIALLGVIKDLTIDRKINGLVMHLTNVLLNIYILMR